MGAVTGCSGDSSVEEGVRTDGARGSGRDMALGKMVAGYGTSEVSTGEFVRLGS